jgi:serine/threonine-protein kinase
VAGRWRRIAASAALVVLTSAITSVLWWSFRVPAAPSLVTRFVLTLPDDARFIGTVHRIVTISRDGTMIAYQTNRGLHLRTLSEPSEKVIPTNGGMNLAFSPDGKWIASYYAQERAIQKLPTAGGTPVKICDLAEAPSGISWDGDDIVFGHRDSGILRVPASGGKPEVIARLQPGEIAAAPHVLPDGDSLLFTLATVSDDRQGWTWDRARIVVQSLQSGRRITLIDGGSDAHYIATGHLVYAVAGVLFARRFDLRDLKTSGESVPVVEGIRRGAGGSTIPTANLFNPAQFAVAENGTLVFVPGPASLSLLRQQLAVFNQDGTSVPLKIPAGPYDYPRVSPDGKQIVYETDDGKDASIWLYDLNGTTSPRRLTLDGRNRFPVWSGDGRWVIFQSDRDGDVALFRVRADGTTGRAERVTKPDAGTSHVPESSSQDGKVLLFSAVKNAQVALQILSLPDGSVRPFPGFLSDRLPNVTFSPDGSRVAYSTRAPNENRSTLLIEPFPPTGAKHFVAGNDAHMPVWSRDGRNLFFLDPSRADNGRVGFVGVAVDTRLGFATGEPHLVKRDFRITAPALDRSRTFDILPDGRFVGVKDEAQPGDAAAPRLEVVLNWTEELKRTLPSK